jgi:hypothetical protein
MIQVKENFCLVKGFSKNVFVCVIGGMPIETIYKDFWSFWSLNTF